MSLEVMLVVRLGTALRAGGNALGSVSSWKFVEAEVMLGGGGAAQKQLWTEGWRFLGRKGKGEAGGSG